MSPLNIAASIAAQVAAVIGARRATRNRRNREAPVTIAGLTINPGSYLALAAKGVHGPEAQRAAIAELECLAWFEQQMKEAS